MSLQAWLLFVATEAVLWLSPGPAVLLVLSASRARGLARRSRVARVLNRTGGALLIGPGAGLATLQRR